MSEADGDDADDPTAAAFQALGDEARLSTLTALLDREPPVPFSELRAATGVEPSARFAYHLRQLEGRYVQKVTEDGDSLGYRLTYAGRKVARAVTAGTYTDSVDRDDVALAADCPHCGADDLTATSTDNVVRVSCAACDRPVLSLPFPPRGYRDRDADSVPRAFDRHHRHRLALLREGVCPECSGRVETTVETPTSGPDEDTSAGSGADRTAETAGRVLAVFECQTCGHGVRTPVTLSLLTHPAVAAFYHDHDEDVRERPLWNVGSEWREAVVSRDPLAVVVSTRLDDELLELYVDGAGRVVDHRRHPANRGTVDAGETTDPEPANEATVEGRQNEHGDSGEPGAPT